ncbi:MAG: hypothetical protein ABSA97_00450 [Verrucomicrobiia bacterium]
MNNATQILAAIDARLNAPVELTLYGRAALALGFAQPPAEFALSRDVDAVLWLGQAEELKQHTNFWEAIEQVNEELADQELYISHLFTEDQVILRPDWRTQRVPLNGPWRRLTVFRLGNVDLLLSKLMRDDPIDRADALFIVRAARLTQSQVGQAIREARVPDLSEIREQFALACPKLLAAL